MWCGCAGPGSSGGVGDLHHRARPGWSAQINSATVHDTTGGSYRSWADVNAWPQGVCGCGWICGSDISHDWIRPVVVIGVRAFTVGVEQPGGIFLEGLVIFGAIVDGECGGSEGAGVGHRGLMRGIGSQGALLELLDQLPDSGIANVQTRIIGCLAGLQQRVHTEGIEAIVIVLAGGAGDVAELAGAVEFGEKEVGGAMNGDADLIIGEGLLR